VLGERREACPFSNSMRRAAQMRWKPRTLFVVISLTAGSVFAQQAEPPPNPSHGAQIVQVRTGSSCGWCTAPSETETIIEPGSISTVSRSLDESKDPGAKTKYRITKRDWEDLKHFIDARVLAAFGRSTGCPGCADEPTGWVAVQFSDGTKKSIAYNSGGEPPVIVELLNKIQTIRAKSLRQVK
jgi:hypothetical protein